MAYKIVLDAGHGGTDPGAIYKERKEKDDNLSLALAVGKILEDNGIDLKLINISIPDAYVEHGNVELLKKEIGLDAESITEKILERL